MTESPPRPTPPAIVAAGPAACAAWEDFAACGALRRGTRANYRAAALRFLRWSEQRGVGLREVTPEAVSEFFAELGVGASTLPVYRSALRRFFDALASRGVIPASPAALAPEKRRPAPPNPTSQETRPAALAGPLR